MTKYPHLNGVSALIPFLALFAGILLPAFIPAAPAAPAADTATKVYSGTWNNRKYKTQGPLTCNLTVNSGNQWQATFTGKGLGKPFTYRTRLTATRVGNRTDLRGVSSVDGERYDWAGTINGANMVCSYRSASGNNGAFQLRQTR
jgi:hypothetical protein